MAKHADSAKKRSAGRIALIVLLSLLVVMALGVGIAYGVLKATWLSDESLPDYTSIEAFDTSLPTEVYASDGETLLAEFQLEDRDPVEFDQISQYVKDATVATEDERFYEHNGVDLYGIARAVVNNLMGGALEGASTLTQQYVRNTVLADEMTDISIKRKLREAYVSIKVEQVYSKDEILLMYLNTVNYGSGAYGIQAASQRYFSKNATDLTLAEAATLVGIPQSPTINNPIDFPDNCLARRNLVLDRMLSNGKITQEEHDAAQAEPIVLNETVPESDGLYLYPYFGSYVRDTLLKTLSYEEVFEGGLTVVSSLDVSAQDIAERVNSEMLAQMGEPFENALVAIDPDNGYIRAMIGGKDYDTTQVNMATGTGGGGRQPGSTFKVFTLVAALEAGVNPATYINAGTTVQFPGWKVSNINYINYGTVPISRAFEVSSNTAFARLIMFLGPEKVAEVAHRMGIDSPLTETGSLTLGASEVNPLEMAEAYATIASGGIHYDPQCIVQILDRRGNVIVDNSAPEGERVLTPEVAHAATEVMKGVIERGTGMEARLNGQVAAGKTGTSDAYLDSYFCGITPQLAVAIWSGDRSNQSIAKPIYNSPGTRFFALFMNEYLADKPAEDFPEAADPPYGAAYKDPMPTKQEDEEEEDEDKDKDDAEKKEEPEKPAKPDKPSGGDTGTTDPGGGDQGGNQGGNQGGGDTGQTDPPVNPDPPVEPEKPVEPETPEKPEKPAATASAQSAARQAA